MQFAISKVGYHRRDVSLVFLLPFTDVYWLASQQHQHVNAYRAMVSPVVDAEVVLHPRLAGNACSIVWCNP